MVRFVRWLIQIHSPMISFPISICVSLRRLPRLVSYDLAVIGLLIYIQPALAKKRLTDVHMKHVTLQLCHVMKGLSTHAGPYCSSISCVCIKQDLTTSVACVYAQDSTDNLSASYQHTYTHSACVRACVRVGFNRQPISVVCARACACARARARACACACVCVCVCVCVGQ